MTGGSIGGAVGTGAGLLLAPETGGASLAIPAAMGALGGGIGSAVSGGGNPWSSALMGGLSGLLGGALGGGQDLAGLGGADSSSAIDAGLTGGTGASSTASGANALGDTGANPSIMANPNYASPSFTGASGDASSGLNYAAGAPTSSIAASSPMADTPNWLQRNILPSWAGGTPSSGNASGVQSAANNVTGQGAKGAASSGLSQYLMPAGLGLAGLNALGIFGGQGSNPVNTTPINNATTGINTPLPQYNYNSVSTPYTGNWYTYGQRPQTPQISNSVMPAAQGGLVQGYATGGSVHRTQQLQIPMSKMPIRKYAVGGMSGQPPMAAPQPMQVPPPGMPQQKPNPLVNAAAFQKGHQLGQMLRTHIKGQGMTPHGMVNGPGKGQDDVVPAKLSKDEYVLSADIPSFLGDGSSSAGAKVLDQFVSNIRKHKTSHGKGFPPKAHSPLSYISKRG